MVTGNCKTAAEMFATNVFAKMLMFSATFSSFSVPRIAYCCIKKHSGCLIRLAFRPVASCCSIIDISLPNWFQVLTFSDIDIKLIDLQFPISSFSPILKIQTKFACLKL